MAVVVLEGIQPWRTNYTLAQVANQQINETRRIGQEYDRLMAQLYPLYVQAEMTGNNQLANSVWSAIQKFQTEKNALFRSTFGVDPSGASTHETDTDYFREQMRRIGTAQNAIADILRWKKERDKNKGKDDEIKKEIDNQVASQTPNSPTPDIAGLPQTSQSQGSKGNILNSLLNAGQNLINSNLGNIIGAGLGLGLGGNLLGLANAIPGIKGQNLFNSLGSNLLNQSTQGLSGIGLKNLNSLPSPPSSVVSTPSSTQAISQQPPSFPNSGGSIPPTPSLSNNNNTATNNQQLQSQVLGPYQPPKSKPSQYINQWLGLNKMFRVI